MKSFLLYQISYLKTIVFNEFLLNAKSTTFGAF